MSGAERTSRQVWIERVRWPDRPQSRAHAFLLGRDEHGTWLGLPGGHDVYRGSTVLYTGPNPVVSCIPDDDWWVANWYGRTVELFIDIVTPARWTATSVAVVDLDMGVMVKQSEARLVDADQFEENRLTYEYPSTVEAGARRAAEEVLARAAGGAGPFDPSTAEGWFAILRAVEDRTSDGDRPT